MIRFKTIEPEKGATPAPKPVEKPAPAVVADTGDGAVEEPTPESKGTEKGKGMTRKTPLRAKKPEAARLFRD